LIKIYNLFNNNYKLILIILISILLNSAIYADEITDQVPAIKNLNFDTNKLSSIVESKQLIIIFPEQKIKTCKYKKIRYFKNARFVSCISIVNAPHEKVKSIVNDYENYSKFMPETISSDVSFRSKDKVIADYTLQVKIPLIKINVKFQLEHYLQKDSDITWRLIKGKMKASIGRWEIIPVSKNKTLLVNTSWSDHKSAGLLTKLLIKSQPDMSTAIPVSTAALMLNAVKNRAEAEAVNNKINDLNKLPEKPKNPLIFKDNIPVNTLCHLASIGTILFVHPKQWIKNSNNKPIDLNFITAGGIVNAPFNKVKQLSTDSLKIKDLLYQIKRVKVHNNGSIIDWRLRFWFYFFTLKLDFTNNYKWIDNNTLIFERLKGDIDYIFGSREYMKISDELTLMFLTLAYQTGENAPFTFNLTKKLPNSLVILGASASTVIIEKQIPWIEKNVKVISEKEFTNK